jgi:hypothetical protein
MNIRSVLLYVGIAASAMLAGAAGAANAFNLLAFLSAG